MEAVAAIRADNRSALSAERNHKRIFELDHRRLLDQTSQESTNVQEIANKLKTKACVSLEDLVSLKNALLTESNIHVFMKTHGALRGLVREFTGSHTGKRQVSAACLCNLALSEGRLAHTVAKAAGVYLLPGLRGLNTELTVTCAWTLGNLAGSHETVCRLLTDQGALASLTSVLSDTVHKEIQEAVCYALIHFVYVLKNNLGQESLSSLLQVLIKIQRDESAYHLLYLLSCHHEFLSPQTTSHDFLLSILNDFHDSIEGETHMTSSEKSIHIVRLLANICTVPSCGDHVLKCWRNPKYYSHVEMALSSKCDKLRSSMLWLLGNIFNCCSHDSDNMLFFTLVSDKI